VAPAASAAAASSRAAGDVIANSLGVAPQLETGSKNLRQSIVGLVSSAEIKPGQPGVNLGSTCIALPGGGNPPIHRVAHVPRRQRRCSRETLIIIVILSGQSASP